MEITSVTPIASIATDIDASIPYFEELRIDYTCDGNLGLKEACDQLGTPWEEVLETLRGIEERSRTSLSHRWNERSMSAIIDHILTHHHPFNRKKIDELNALLEKLPPVYGFDHPQLIFLKDLFKEMGNELKVHMSKEEEVIFPYLAQREKAEAEHRSIPNPFLDHPFFRQPIRVLEWEHQITGQEWKQVNLLTNGYTTPHGTGSIYKALFEGLKELEKDLRRHVHLENNVLFKKALEKGWLE